MQHINHFQSSTRSTPSHAMPSPKHQTKRKLTQTLRPGVEMTTKKVNKAGKVVMWSRDHVLGERMQGRGVDRSRAPRWPLSCSIPTYETLITSVCWIMAKNSPLTKFYQLCFSIFDRLQPAFGEFWGLTDPHSPFEVVIHQLLRNHSFQALQHLKFAWKPHTEEKKSSNQPKFLTN